MVVNSIQAMEPMIDEIVRRHNIDIGHKRK